MRPLTTTSPFFRIATRSQSVSTSFRMWVEKKMGATALALVDDQVPHLFAADRVETAHGLVQDQELRVGHQRGRQPRPLQHALR